MRLNRYYISHPCFISLSLSSNQFSSMYFITITYLIRSFETTSSLSYLLHFLLMLLSYFIYLIEDINTHTHIYISRLLNTTYKWLYVCLCMDLWCITFEGVTKSPLRDHPWDVEAASKLPTLIVYAYYFQWGKDMK